MRHLRKIALANVIGRELHVLAEHEGCRRYWSPVFTKTSFDPLQRLAELSGLGRYPDRSVVKEQPRARLAPVIAVLVSHVPGGWAAARAFEDLFDPDAMALSELAGLVPRFSLIVEERPGDRQRALVALDDLQTVPRQMGLSRRGRT